MDIKLNNQKIENKDIVSLEGNFANKITLKIKNIKKYEDDIFSNPNVTINDQKFFYFHFNMNNEYSECTIHLARDVAIDFSFLDSDPNGKEIQSRIEDILREYCLIK